MHIKVKVIEVTSFFKMSHIKHDFRTIDDSISVIISCYVHYLMKIC